MKYFFATIGIIALLIGGGIAVKIIFFPVNTLQKEIDIAYDAQDRVLDADNAIYNYEWFKQQLEDINAGKKKYDNASINFDNYVQMLGTNRDKWTFEDKTEYNRLNSVKLGIQNQIEDMIATYNARAKMATRNIFQNSVLPDYLDALTFIRK